MKLTGAKKQTLFLTGVNGVVRALGLAMRIWMSRILGAETMGIIELAQSAHMVYIAPLTSGLPLAISRLTARAKENEKEQPLMAGLQLVRTVSFVLVPLVWLLSPVIAKFMGDLRVLPSLWFSAPCILILGYSAAYNGYCYGVEHSELPATSELIEQTVRFIITITCLRALKHMTAPWMAAVPVFATMTAEIMGLAFVIKMVHASSKNVFRKRYATKAIVRLAAPATCTRLIQTALRSATAIMIPMRLQASGLTTAEATSQLGLLNGMVTPFLMLPGIFTSALSMVMIPKIAKAEEQPCEFRRLLKLSFFSCVPFSILCAFSIYAGSTAISLFIYRQADLIILFRFCAPQIVLMTISQLISSILSAVGQQRRSMYVSSITAVATLIFTWYWTGQAQMRLYGVMLAHYTSHLLSILLGILALVMWSREKHGHSW